MVLTKTSMVMTEAKLIDLLSGEILPSERLGNYFAMSGGLGGGMLNNVNYDPSVVWERIWWDHPFAMYVFRDLIAKDDKIGSDLETRMEAVLAKPRIVKPASEKRADKKIADFISETLEGYMGGSDGIRFGFHNFLWEALDAIGKGVAIGENVYDFANDRVYIKEVKFKPQMLFSFAEGSLAQYQSYALPQTGPMRLRPELAFAVEGVDPEQPLPDKKFFVHTFRPYQGDRWGSPLVLRTFWLAYFKKAGLKQWLRYLERGAGTVLAKYPSGAGKDEKAVALQAAQAVAEESMAAVSKGTEIEVLENVRSSLGDSHNQLIDRCDNAIARVILGQTLTSRGSEGGGSRALGEVHERVAERKTEVDSNSLMLAVNTQLVFPLVLLNQGPVERPPIWTIQYEPGADLKLMSEILYRAWQMRVPISKKYYYTMMQMPEPAEDEEVLEPPESNEEDSAPPGGTGGESATFSETDDGATSAAKKKSAVKRQALEAANLEEAALRDAAPVYDRILRKIIQTIEANTGAPALLPTLVDTWELTLDGADEMDVLFRPLIDLLSDSLLASCLLGVDHGQQNIEVEQLRSAVFGRRSIQFQDPISTAFNVPPKEAIDYFKAKKIVRKGAFNKLSREAKSGAFTVGGAYKEDVLRGFKDELRAALERGRTQAQTIQRFQDILAGAGHRQLGEFHLETVFRTNMQTAYGVGRRSALEEVKDDLPFWQYHAVGDDRTRPTHAALNGVTLPADNPFWDTHFAPWDFNCRCSVTASADPPAGYDPKNPTGAKDDYGEPVVHISYDADGAPAKAEMGTTLYDLKVGNFQGIPRGATLLSAIEAGAKRATRVR